MHLTIGKMSTMTSEELCTFLGIKSLRSLATTPGFPESFFDKDKIVFNRADIQKYFDVDNLDEPFISLKEAARYLGISRPKCHTLTFNNKIPSYRLKSAKGSGYLYRKSELEKIKKMKLYGNTDFVNYFVGTTILKDVLVSVLTEINGGELHKHSQIVCNYLLDRMTLEEIAQQENLTRERIRQIISKEISRVKKTKFHSPKAYIELERKVIEQEGEINMLNLLLKQKSEDISEFHVSKRCIEIVATELKKPLHEFDLSVRALNCLKVAGLFTMYELAAFCYKGNPNSLFSIRNMGQKTLVEIKEALESCRVKLEKNTGLDLLELINSDVINMSNQGNLQILREIQIRMGLPISL